MVFGLLSCRMEEQVRCDHLQSALPGTQIYGIKILEVHAHGSTCSGGLNSVLVVPTGVRGACRAGRSLGWWRGGCGRNLGGLDGWSRGERQGLAKGKKKWNELALQLAHGWSVEPGAAEKRAEQERKKTCTRGGSITSQRHKRRRKGLEEENDVGSSGRGTKAGRSESWSNRG